MRPIEHIIEQLWQPIIDSSDVRLVENGRPEAGWNEAEAYWLIPSAARARMLVAVGPARASRRLLTNYRRLRTARTNAARSVLGAIAGLGVPLSRDRVSLQARIGAEEARASLPLERLARLLGSPLVAATGVRTGDNRKATLHLVDRAGSPVGYAKVGWNPATDLAVANETRVLSELGGGAPKVKVPRPIARLDHFGHPVVVVEPLPLEARGAHQGIAAPTPQEVAALTPLTGAVPLDESGLFQGVVSRLRQASAAPLARPVTDAALGLAADLARTRAVLPVVTRWHGDLAPWNVARDREDRLWVWDWESSEADAVAGLDHMHWVFSEYRSRARDADAMDLTEVLDGANRNLRAWGLDPRGGALVAGIYALTVVERACALAAGSGTWNDAFIKPPGLVSLCAQGRRILAP